MSENKDPRIGTMSGDAIEWPTQTISGKPFDRKNSVSLMTLDGSHFAVKDHYPSANEDAIVLELQAILAPKTSKVLAPKDSSNG